MMNWRLTGIILLSLLVVSVLIISCTAAIAPADPKPTDVTGVQNKLFIPPIQEDEDPGPTNARLRLTAQESTKTFLQDKKTKTYGYNGDYLGPTIRVKKGELVGVKVLNNLTDETTVHWHGLLVEGQMDGGPQQIILPRNEWNPNFVINQPAATLWYHAHPVHMTGSQVYRGLAGLFIIDDEESEGLNLPDDYGVNDIPLIIQDRRFAEDGTLIYKTSMDDIMQGMLGDTILVNGTVNPVLEVATVKTRFRLLNGANARTFDLKLSDETGFVQIASDGGLLESPVEMKSLILAPGERAEVVIDFSTYSEGDMVSLQSPGFNIIDFRVTRKEDDNSVVPKKLAVIPKIPGSASVKTRSFELMGMGPMVSINGRQMDMTRIDEIVKHGGTEIWEIRNLTMGMGPMMGMQEEMGHTFHYHGVQFQVLSRDGRQPPLNERGWKDTILVNPNETVKVIARFDYKGLYMYHCHILEHEDAGMMGQFEVK
jgi:blue copper oxidase